MKPALLVISALMFLAYPLATAAHVGAPFRTEASIENTFLRHHPTFPVDFFDPPQNVGRLRAIVCRGQGQAARTGSGALAYQHFDCVVKTASARRLFWMRVHTLPTALWTIKFRGWANSP